MAKKLKIRIPDRKEDVLLETTQRGIGWARRFQAPLTIGIVALACLVVLLVYGSELEKKGDAVAWEEYRAIGPDQEPSAYQEIAERFPDTTIVPWALLDQAHALVNTGEEADSDAAMEIYRDIGDRYPEQELIRFLATEGRQNLLREMEFSPPSPPPGGSVDEEAEDDADEPAADDGDETPDEPAAGDGDETPDDTPGETSTDTGAESPPAGDAPEKQP